MKNYTKIKFIALSLVALLAAQSCDNGFEDLNRNPDAVSEPTAAFIFTKSQLDAVNSSPYATLSSGSGGFIQHFATYKDVPSLGDRYTWSQGSYPYAFFTDVFPKAVNEISEVISAVSEDPDAVNKLATARIWRVFIVHRITDLYGDIPYSEAGRGYSDAIYSPKYDEQEFIYNDMLNELEQAAAAFDPSKETFGAADLLYGGDTDQWKKFAYSLMLRLGSRLTKADIAGAESWVKKAIAGGVITADDDIARIEYTDGPQTFNRNPVAFDLISNDYGAANGVDNKEGGKLAKTFIDHLVNTGDPRLGALAVVWKDGAADTTATLQKGMPNGLVGGSPPADFGTFSEPNPATVLKYSSPLLLLTNAEVNLLLAEAALRGWDGGDAAAYYEDAIEASMRSWGLYDAAGVISPSRIATYVSENPLPAGTFEEQMEGIHTQFWVTLFPNELEIFANWRRTGYPVLTPINAPGNLTGGTIPRRSIYPPSEESLNGPNYYEAVSRITGGDSFVGRVWWDQ